jgi:CubicO group peptidase (beta-lactamase class C family)
MTKKLSVLIFCLLCSLYLPACANRLTLDVTGLPAKTEVNGLAPADAEAVTAIAREMMEQLHSPGLGVGIVTGETLAYAGYFGWQDEAAGRPVSAETAFRIGSISKSVTTVGLLQQWEQGKFQLDDDINKYLPATVFFPPHPESKPATFRTLLTHTSGAGEFLSMRQVLQPGFGVIVKGTDYRPVEDYLRLGFHTHVDPGAKYAYSNYGFALLGYALERLSGQPFNQYMKEQVFAPLGIQAMTYEHTDAMLESIPAGYSYQGRGQRYKITAQNGTGITPAGNIYANVPEFALYVEALLNGGRNKNGAVLKPETMAMMLDPKLKHTFDPRQASYGFGIVGLGDGVWGRRILGHDGSVPFGNTSAMLLAPDDKIGVFVFANSNTRAPVDIAWAILKQVLHAEDRPPTEVEPDRSRWSELVGYYGPEFTDFKTSTRIYMSGVGRYRIDIKRGQLRLSYLWQSKRKSSMVLHQVSASDPWFFWYEDPRHPGNHGPNYLAFKQGPRGQIYLIPGGLEEFVKLDLEREDKALVFAPIGKVLGRVNPF